MQLLYKLGAPILAAALFVGGCSLLVKIGKMQGAAEIQSLWDKDAEARKEVIDKLQGRYDLLQSEHKSKVEELTNELQTSTDKFQTTLNGYRLDYDKRMQLATNRAGVYQRQAQGTAAERDSLAEHAARLDRSLEEGRSLVRELRATLGQREVTIRSLGGIILSDRTLLESE